jgi:hypothetical protein
MPNGLDQLIQANKIPVIQWVMIGIVIDMAFGITMNMMNMVIKMGVVFLGK